MVQARSPLILSPLFLPRRLQRESGKPLICWEWNDFRNLNCNQAGTPFLFQQRRRLFGRRGFSGQTQPARKESIHYFNCHDSYFRCSCHWDRSISSNSRNIFRQPPSCRSDLPPVQSNDEESESTLGRPSRSDVKVESHRENPARIIQHALHALYIFSLSFFLQSRERLRFSSLPQTWNYSTVSANGLSSRSTRSKSPFPSTCLHQLSGSYFVGVFGLCFNPYLQQFNLE